ncbi:MAG: caspase family protein [Chloroflexia bacterium]|nr:caspase family protein [Chloroflexia bacterium]
MSAQFTHGYALLVGVGQSSYAGWSLPATVKDVQAIQKILADPALCAYPEANIRLLHDQGATVQAILEGLAWLKERAAADPEATVVVYYSGHGWLSPTGQYYLVPHDVRPFDVAGSALPAAAFHEALRAISPRRLLALMDCCHAAGLAGAKDGPALELPGGFVQAALPKDLAQELAQGAGRAVFSSSLGEQQSWVRPDEAMSIYTYHLIEALQGAGNKPGDTLVQVSNLMGYLGRAVTQSARSMRGAEQTPFFDVEAEDFPIAVLRGGKGLPSGGWEAVQQEAARIIQNITHVEARGERSVAIGGAATGNVFSMGDRVSQRGKYNVSIGEAQGVVVGDGAETAQTFVGGDVRDSTLVTAGHDATVTQGATAEQIQALFAPILQQIERMPPDPDVDKDEIVETVEKIRDEAAKAEDANTRKVRRWLRFLVEMSPDIWDVVVKTVANPVYGFAEAVRKVAKRAQEERTGGK